MKPIHEQAWVAGVEPYGTGERVVVRTDERRTVAHLPAYDPKSLKARRGNAALISAAPDMARALMADMVLWEDGLMHDEFRCPILSAGSCADWCAAKRAALRKAGVIPTQLPATPDDNQS